MAKPKRLYACSSCGARQLKWQGQCPDCGEWNTLTEAAPAAPGRAIRGVAAPGAASLTRLDSLEVAHVRRRSSGLTELDRVLGGGLVPGAVVLIGGDPGIGKSTLLLSAIASLSRDGGGCYVTGEESLDQIGLRADRLGVGQAPVQLLSETCVESIIGALSPNPPEVLVIDSIQTLFSENLDSAPGSVAQLRECAAQLVRFAKQQGVSTVLVGHVTKEGTLAGPRVLEHMVDTVLYFESDLGSRFRIIRTAKNRFGAANELGFFVMGEQGFKEVRNPSAIFLARRSRPRAREHDPGHAREFAIAAGGSAGAGRCQCRAAAAPACTGAGLQAAGSAAGRVASPCRGFAGQQRCICKRGWRLACR